MSENIERWYATGRRKRAVARVWMSFGNGTITVNRQDENTYFPRAVLRMIMRQSLELVEVEDKYDFLINVSGGGISAQAEACRFGISRVLTEANSEYRPSLKKAGFLTRDAREVERKKYGKAGARRSFQFSKR